MPRIGEGLRLRGSDGMWASFDVIDVWYQKADFGDLWAPYLHVRITPGEGGMGASFDMQDVQGEFEQFET